MKEEIDYIYAIPKFVKKASLENTREMLRRLAVDEQRMKIVHVAGTNGKGSVCAYLAGILRAGGHTVGLFTSPHLVDIRERIVINGEMIGEAEFEETFAAVKTVALAMEEDGFMHPSFFEFLFGMAMTCFAAHRVEYLILETGLGGRLDATNVVTAPLATVITSISLDHTDILGDTYAKIAYEKAGIVKPHVPVIFWDNRKEVSEVIASRARSLDAPAYPLSFAQVQIGEIGADSIDFSLGNAYYDNEPFCVPTGAKYQADNAALAVVTAAVALKADVRAVRAGLAATTWAGRMQKLEPDLIVDGAHNEDGITRFLESVAADGGDKTRVLLLSAVADKHYRDMVRRIVKSDLFAKVYVGRLTDARGLNIEIFRKTFAENKPIPVEFDETVEAAYRKVRAEQKRGNRVYVAGSLYLVGEVLALYHKEMGE